MELYIAGVIFFILGLGIKALAAKFRLISVPRIRRTVSDVLVITIGASTYLSNMLIFLLLIEVYDATGLPNGPASWAAWFTTFFLVAIFCVLVGWKVGPGPTQRARMPEAFAENPDNPFGAADVPNEGFDLNAADAEKP
jgi:hypothetical protein